MAKENFAEKSGSALILVVVLTSLLSILAVMFMLSSRVDKITASAISDNKELDFSIDSVVAKISQQLIDDVNFATHAYYDYPDAKNPWLANLEPYQAGGNYYWQHISDIYNKLGLSQNVVSRQALIKKDYQDTIEVGDSSVYTGVYYLADADGDGVSDSVWVELPDVNSGKGKPVYAAVRVIDNGAMLNVNTAYLFDPNAIDSSRVDGSRQTQINLAALARGTDDIDVLHAARAGSEDPCNIDSYLANCVWNTGEPTGKYQPFDISDELILRNRYMVDQNSTITRLKAVWKKTFDRGGGFSRYTPLELGDSLDPWFNKVSAYNYDEFKWYYPPHIATTYNMDRLIAPDGMPMVNANVVPNAEVLYGKLRGCIDPCALDWNKLNANMAQIAANIKDYGDSDANVTTVYDLSGKAHYGFEKPCIFISELVYKLVKVQIPPPGGPSGAPAYQTNWSYGIELSKLYPGDNNDNWRLLIDSTSYPLLPDFTSSADKYYVKVFEDPNASLLSMVNFNDSPLDGETDVNPNVVLSWPASWMPGVASYDVYFGTSQNDVNESATPKEHQWPSTFYDPVGSLSPNPEPSEPYYWRIDDLDASGSVVAKGNVWNFRVGNPEPNVISLGPDQHIFDANSIISLQREVNGHWLTVDFVQVPAGLVEEPNAAYTGIRSFQRDMSEARWIKRLWSNDVNVPPTLGYHNDFNNPAAGSMQARPGPFNNVGDLAMVFSKSTYYDINTTPADAVGYTLSETEDQVRIDLRDPNFQRIFQYVSAFGHADSQGRVKGRININTAPWYVIAQLPWVSQRRDNTTLMAFTDYKLAQAIAGYRDKTIVDTNLSYADTTAISNDGRYEGTGLSGLREAPGFESIGELATVVNKFDAPADSRRWYSMRYYIDGLDQAGFPDIDNSRQTLIDNATDDFEERYLIFSRISDLVTVRSDVFTAYILVRVGNNGPQKRVIAILDRSDVPAGGKVKVIAVHPVPDPR